MLIHIRTKSGKAFILDVEPDNRISEVKVKISEQDAALVPNTFELLYAGKRLDANIFDNSLNTYNIGDGSTLHLIDRPVATLPTNYSAREAQRGWKKKAEIYDFDEDLHIVDPQSYYRLLEDSEEDIYRSSEFVRSDGLIQTSVLSMGQQAFQNLSDRCRELRVSKSLETKILQNLPVYSAFEDTITLLEYFWHFLQSRRIAARVEDSIEQMQAQNTCKNTINILQQHRSERIIEVRRLACATICDLNKKFDETAVKLLDFVDEDNFSIEMQGVSALCREIMIAAGFQEHTGNFLSLRAAFTFIRKTCLLLDMAVTSYAGSHCFRYDDERAAQLGLIEISDGEDPFAFECSWERLACLDAFVDNKKVLVFHFFHKKSKVALTPRESKREFYLLARIEDVADIWGPVYTIPSESGLIKYYGVSKGVICRIKEAPTWAFPGAIQCHYFSRTSYFIQKTSRILSGGTELLLAENDLLLIGGGLRENWRCNYSMSSFKEDYVADITVLGTCEAVWKLENRGIGLGVSKIVGITVSGNQKLVPQTSRKEHTQDRWSTNPSRANPGILNELLGVEISHCTGNARRITLRTLMTLRPISSVLELQYPSWNKEPWGKAFDTALRDIKPESIFQVWKEFASNRTEMAGLVCSVLDLLDRTGFVRSDVFHAALLHQNDESAVCIDKDLNDWTSILKDTHMTSAYVVINQNCLNCSFPNHSASSCHIPRAFTVLETQIVFGKASKRQGCRVYNLWPGGRRLKEVDEGAEIMVFESDVGLLGDLFKSDERYRASELCKRVADERGHLIYLKASHRSQYGKAVPRPPRHQLKQNPTLKAQHAAPLKKKAASESESSKSSLGGEGSAQTRSSKSRWLSVISKPKQQTESRLLTRDENFGPQAAGHAEKVEGRGTYQLPFRAGEQRQKKRTDKHPGEVRQVGMRIPTDTSASQDDQSKATANDLISSDVSGQNFFDHYNLATSSMLNDMKNFDLDD